MRQNEQIALEPSLYCRDFLSECSAEKYSKAKSENPQRRRKWNKTLA
jgi:hypothetical protein